MNTAADSLDSGVYAATPENAREKADVKAWHERIEQGRKYDEEARKQYAKDRRYARGDSGFVVDANLIGTNIDILESFYYAKDPDIDVMPAAAVQPPSMDAMREAAEASMGQDPMLQQAGQMALQQGINPAEVQALQAQAVDQQAQAQFEQIQERFAKRQRDAKAFAETLEIICARLWRDARLKFRGRQWVRTALSVGLGILKASWQERTAPSPETTQAINDLQANMKRARATEVELSESGNANNEALLADFERQLETLQSQTEQVIARGFCVDTVAPENLQVAPGVTMANYLDAPWIAERIPYRVDDAAAEFGLTPEQRKQATKYRARKPIMGRSDTAEVSEQAVTAAEADAFVGPQSTGDSSEAEGGEFVMAWEVWDRDTGSVLTAIEGVCQWVKPAWRPAATERFYPYFLLPFVDVDGQRHPQSLVSRSAKLADEYNRIGTAEREHRKRVTPQTLFNEEQLKPATVKKLTEGVSVEFVGIETTGNVPDMRALFMEKPYPAIDPALYDRQRIVNELERIWGVQEALSGSIETPKTATEAEIQQTGFQARTGGRRDVMESALGELAQYTAEIARAFVTYEDAVEMAGPDAFWPKYAGPGDLRSLVNVDIRAGSSGKPNTSADRAAWAQTLPVLQAGMLQVAQLRGSLPADVADCIEGLLKITAERSGERIDLDQFMPKAGPIPAPGLMPEPTTEGEPPQ